MSLARTRIMARIMALNWLCLACIVGNLLKIEAQENGFSAVTEADQDMPKYSYNHGRSVKNWVNSGRPGLFITNGFNKTENSTFHIQKSGVYYITANVIITTKDSPWSYSRTVDITGSVWLTGHNGEYLGYNQRQKLRSHVTMKKYQQKNLRITGYVKLESGWQLSINLGSGYSRRKSVKAGSTLSLMYVSSPSMFPGVLLKNNYEYLHLESPNYSADVVNWNEIYEGTNFPMSEGNFMIPHKGLYHVLVNLNIRRYSDTQLKFAIMIDNKTEAITRTTTLDSGGTNTITVEGVLDVAKNQTISIKVSSPSKESTTIYLRSSSTFFIFSRGTVGGSTPEISTSYKSTSTLAKDAWYTLNQWDITSKHSFDHYSSVELQHGQFVSPKPGVYQVIVALYLSNCTKAAAKLSLKTVTSNTYQAIAPDISFTKKRNNCYLQNSLLLKMNANDTLKLQVKSDMKYKVLTQTSYQVVFENRFSLWPAAIFKLLKFYSFKTNSAAVKIPDWSHSNEGNWNDVFFNVNKENIQIKIPGLYLVSYNLIVTPTSVVDGLFESNVVVNGKLTAYGSKCQRENTPQLFTCSKSTLLNLIDKDTLAIQVTMTDDTKKKQDVHIRTVSQMTLTFIGDARAHPAFKLNVKSSSTSYTTKAKATDTKSLTDFTFSNKNFFQSAAMYSKDVKGFTTGRDNGFFLLNNLQFNLLNDGVVASVFGSKERSIVVYGKDHKKSHSSVSGSDLSFNESFYFNVSGKASKSDFKWKPESGSVVSGFHIGNRHNLVFFKAQLKANSKVQCSKDWSQVSVKDWNLMLYLNDIGTIIPAEGIQISTGGFYVTALNFAIKSNNTNTVTVGFFVDREQTLTASETSPGDTFSMSLQGVLELTSKQIIAIKVKCETPTEITYAKGGGISAFRVDKSELSPGLRLRLSPGWDRVDNIRKFRPWYYNNQQSNEQFIEDIKYFNYEITVTKSGLYLVTLVGYAGTEENYELAFSTKVNGTIFQDSTCSLTTSPLYLQDTSQQTKPITMTAFVSLKENEEVGLLGRYPSYWSNYRSRFYISIQYVGNIDTSSGVTATLQKDSTFTKGTNLLFKDKAWVSGSTCGKFATRNVPTEFGKYKVLYTGYYVVSMNLVLKYKDGCGFGFCFTINGKSIDSGVKGLNAGCFKHNLQTGNKSSITTVSGSELLYLEAGQQLSVQMESTLGITITGKSSFSAFYFGTAGAIYGFSSIISTTAHLREMPSKARGYYWGRYEYEDDDVYFEVRGWKSDIPKAKMLFNNGMDIPQKDMHMFVCPREGIYMVIVKINVKGKIQTNSTCEVQLQLTVDGEYLDFDFKKKFVGSENTLSFTTTLRLEKWEGVTVKFIRKRMGCPNMEIGAGSSLAIVYLDSGKKAFTLWPNIGPHIVESPQRNVFVRVDKANTEMVTCKAVGEYPIKYEWQMYGGIVYNESSTLDIKNLNSSSLTVKCVVTMGKLVAESRYVNIRVIDPTVIFSDTYNNRSYDIPENTSAGMDVFKDVLVFGAREKISGYYYYYRRSNINCTITKGNINNTFLLENKYLYHWGYGDNDQYFTLRARARKLDRELISEYNVEITCGNIKYKDAASAKTTIQVVILDANDNLPVFDQEIYEATIKKNIQPGKDIIQVLATDDDIEENGKISYSLVYSSDSYIFAIDKEWGIISLGAHEKLSKPYYRMTAMATDKGTPPRSSYVTVVFVVKGFESAENRTNNHPVFDRPLYSAYLLRGTPVGTTVTVVDAHDPNTFEHRGIRYYIFSGDDSVFMVDSKRGVIKTKGKVTKSEYNLEIAAEYTLKKPGPEYYNLTEVIILVRDVDTTRPNFEPTLYEATIPENADFGSEVLTVKAEYLNGKLEYSLPNSKSAFKIDKHSGLISVGAKLDYEVTREYTFVVSAKDTKDDQKGACTDVTVHLKDMNDNSPVFFDYPNKTFHVKQLHGRKLLTHVQASDKDSGPNGEIKYYIKYDYGGAFSIDPDSGKLYVDRGQLDCCDVVYGIVIEAKDQGVPPRNDTVTITVIPIPTRHHGTDPHPHNPHNPHAQTDSSQKTYIIVGAVGGVVVLIIIAGLIFWRRRRRLRNYESATMNYMSLPSDEEDEELLDAAGAEHSEDDNNRRLSLISSASDDNLLKNEEPC